MLRQGTFQNRSQASFMDSSWSWRRPAELFTISSSVLIQWWLFLLADQLSFVLQEIWMRRVSNIAGTARHDEREQHQVRGGTWQFSLRYIILISRLWGFPLPFSCKDSSCLGPQTTIRVASCCCCDSTILWSEAQRISKGLRRDGEESMC